MTDAALALATPGAPALVALLLLWRATRAFGERLVPWAALPALVAAVRGLPAQAVQSESVLLGATLGLTPLTAGFLLFTALLWLLAGLFARAYLHDDPRRAAFYAFFLATLAGNLGLIVARDAATFYACFTLMTFAAYGLVMHARTPEADRAGRAYIALAVVGEAFLLGGLLLAAGESASLRLDDMRAAIASSDRAPLIVGLLYAGFGVKAGALPVHVWLPLAHPVAPTPASAVLSGAMIKAGLLGWLLFLPPGAPGLEGLGTGILAAGLAAAFYGVAVGLLQTEPKTILAYSSISQMGLMAVAVGAALASAQAAPAATTAAAVYAFHHGLAKGALFLGAGVAAGRGLPTPLLLGLLALPALSLAGAPFTSGAAAKAALKPALDAVAWQATVLWLLSVAALGTTLIMARFLFVMRRVARGASPSHRLPVLGTVAWITSVVLALLAPWLIVEEMMPAVTFSDAWSGVWPVLLGAGLALLAARVPGPWRAWRVPPGDVLGAFWSATVGLYRATERAGGWVGDVADPAWRAVQARWRHVRAWLGDWKARSEAQLLAGTGTGALVLLALLAAAVLLPRISG